MNFINSLTLWQWGLLALVPPAIVALYFLKLKRQPLEVPSTYLWSRTIEDLHVNSIWQRLRQSLLLFLQLLLVALIVIACTRPGWRGSQLTGERFIFLIDTSASMSATDIQPTRLESAKEQILGLIEQMKSDDVAMIISFSDIARVEQSFTSSRSLLRQCVNQIDATNRKSNLSEALRAAAGLANPGRTSDENDTSDIPVADPLPATLYLYTDGGFESVPDFSLGNLEPEYVRIGTDEPDNAAIVAFTAERNSEKPDQLQAFARFENTGSQQVVADASLYLDDELIDARSVTIDPGGSAGADFDLTDVDRGVLKIELEHDDALQLDNVAFAAINTSRTARVLLVTDGNVPLERALATDQVQQMALVTTVTPANAETDEQQRLTTAGFYDLVIYDRCTPNKMPQANTWFIGRIPPLEGWSRGEKEVQPFIIDIDRMHPMTLYIDLGNVTVVEGFAVTTPIGGSVLIDSDLGALLAIAPREGFEDAALGFEIVSTDQQGELTPSTDWIVRRSFPVFVMNTVRYLGGVSDATTSPTVQPGQPIVLRTQMPVESLTVKPPLGKDWEVPRDSQNAFVFSDTRHLGVYDVYEGSADEVSQRFTVNLFDVRESNLKPRQTIQLGHFDVTAKANVQPARQEMWKWLLAAGLAILMVEWYIYNRRVYL